VSNDETKSKFNRDIWPFYWISRTNGLYLKELEAELKKSGLDIPRWRALMLLGNDRPRSVSYLATESVAKLNTMTRIIQRMREEGLVKVQSRASDARVTEAYLTEKGEKARVVAFAHANKVVSRAFDGVSQSEMESLIHVLSKVMDNLEG